MKLIKEVYCPLANKVKFARRVTRNALGLTPVYFRLSIPQCAYQCLATRKSNDLKVKISCHTLTENRSRKMCHFSKMSKCPGLKPLISRQYLSCNLFRIIKYVQDCSIVKDFIFLSLMQFEPNSNALYPFLR